MAARRYVGGALLAAVALAGCGGGDEGGAKLTVYMSAPLTGPRAAEARDLVAGAELALADAGSDAGGVPVDLEVLDDADRTGWTPALTGSNARRASQDTTTIAYLGELDSGATRTSLPITNEAGILQVSAGSGAEDLTRDALGSDELPDEAQPSGVRSFGRVTASDTAQGEAAAMWMSQEGIEDVQVFDSGDAFGDSLLNGFESVTGAPSIGGPGADAAYYATASFEQASPDESIIAAADARLFGSDALLEEHPEELAHFPEICRSRNECPSEPRELLVTSAALDPSQLPDAASDFLAAFEEAEGREPGRWAAPGYEAMAVILDSIDRAEDPLDRAAVRDAFFATADRDSILGTYSVDEVGDTTLPAIGAYRVERGVPIPEPDPIELP